MKGEIRSGRRWKGAARVAAFGAVVAGVSGAGCLNRPLEPNEPRTTSTIVERLTQSSVDKIDLLLGIDNSRSMADKQEILALAVPDLVARLVNPICVDPNNVPTAMQPAGPTEDCPPGTVREFEPVLDIHIGIVSSSIGSAGGSACIATADKPTVDDHGRLLARRPMDSALVPTYQEKGFLAWDPTGKLDPAGEPSISNLVANLTEMVKGVGQVGCGYEAQLESWYRFLVDTEPYESISVVDNPATPDNDPAATPSVQVDEVLLAQRRDFLRPDSLLAIIILTDENDCSIKEFGQFYFAGQLTNGMGPYHLPRARAECTANPNDKCCKSCGQAAGDCPADPGCSAPLGDVEDHANLRCYDQKRRFGIDFLYPTQRYVDALSSVSLANRAGQLVPNPLFSDLNPQDQISNIRDPGLIFFAGIVGVPWQDIARDPTDLTKGLKNAEELQQPISENGPTTWDVILGDPANYVPPLDPLMIETYVPRSGTNPITGDPIAAPGTPNGTNPINGHEYTIGGGGDPYSDLQYACIFELPTARDCAGATGDCDCDAAAAPDSPLCEGSIQERAKAYPGVRELTVLRDVQSQGIVASVCPSQVSNTGAADFGYRPAIGAIVDRLKVALGGQCLPRTLVPDELGQVQCLILEARKSDTGCDCDPAKARQPVTEDHRAAESAARADPFAATAGWNCFCEITQLTNGDPNAATDDKLFACQNDLNNPPVLNNESVDGWCYVDATTSPPTGNPEIVSKCPDTERRLIRFVGDGEAQAGGTLFITCSGD